MVRIRKECITRPDEYYDEQERKLGKAASLAVVGFSGVEMLLLVGSFPESVVCCKLSFLPTTLAWSEGRESSTTSPCSPPLLGPSWM